MWLLDFRLDTHFRKSLSAIISLKLFGCNSFAAGKEGPAISSRTSAALARLERSPGIHPKLLSLWYL